jgi:hypothetical protein
MLDPRVEAQAYLEQHTLTQLLEALTAQLLFNKPDNPRQFIIRYLASVQLRGPRAMKLLLCSFYAQEQVKTGSTQPLLDERQVLYSALHSATLPRDGPCCAAVISRPPLQCWT